MKIIFETLFIAKLAKYIPAIIALKEESDIRIISDTVATKSYAKYGFTFVPQTFWGVRNLRCITNTFCYHPNAMNNEAFDLLEKFIAKNANNFKSFPISQTKKKFSIIDAIFRKIVYRKKFKI